MYLGRVQLGEWLTVPLNTDDRLQPTAPPAAPSLAVFDHTGAKVAQALVPAADLAGVTGLFAARIRLGATFATGRYLVCLQYRTAGGASRLKAAHFDVVAGGDANGAIVAMTFYQRPQANYLVCRLDSDQRLLARNPRI